MAMRGRMEVMGVLVLVAFVSLQCGDAVHGSSMVKFTTPSGLSQEDLSMWQTEIVDTEDQFLDEPTRRLSSEEFSMWDTQTVDSADQFLDEPTRRLLAARRRSYISYGALDGNRSPCPSRSGRSYYTPNCAGQQGPVNPYRRGCYQITRCARG